MAGLQPTWPLMTGALVGVLRPVQVAHDPAVGILLLGRHGVQVGRRPPVTVPTGWASRASTSAAEGGPPITTNSSRRCPISGRSDGGLRLSSGTNRRPGHLRERVEGLDPGARVDHHRLQRRRPLDAVSGPVSMAPRSVWPDRAEGVMPSASDVAR